MDYIGNEAVYKLLISLTKDETLQFLRITEKTLEDFSVNGERAYQPPPTSAARRNGQRTLFRPFTSDSAVGAKIIVTPPPKPDGTKDPLHGLIILLDGKGIPTGLMAAEEITGYRTSMNAMVPFFWRKRVENIVIFGGGMQALWHTRLILALRRNEVRRITFVNSSRERVDTLIATVSRENVARESDCEFDFISSTDADAQERIKAHVAEADCVFCTTPSTSPLFPASYLTERSGTHAARQPFIAAVGSWQSDMIEIDPALLHYAISAQGGINPITGEATGVLLVDDRDYALENAGEVVQSGVTTEQMVEIGQIIALRGGNMQCVSDEQVVQTNRFVSEGSRSFVYTFNGIQG
ncbi:shikimate/quinate 5-dehydrogenase [Aspergillus keveii]|uniref:Shikimate/quinate 5-dehydrogenase n=1 Tax=Aspergillus keveii TaxID=714993 RepID=A0ABR4G245_9EURO